MDCTLKVFILFNTQTSGVQKHTACGYSKLFSVYSCLFVKMHMVVNVVYAEAVISRTL